MVSQKLSAFWVFLRPFSPSKFGLKCKSGSKFISCRSFGLWTILLTSSSLSVVLVTGGSNSEMISLFLNFPSFPVGLKLGVYVWSALLGGEELLADLFVDPMA